MKAQEQKKIHNSQIKDKDLPSEKIGQNSLKNKSSINTPKPSKLSVRSSFSVFLADFKASNSK